MKFQKQSMYLKQCQETFGLPDAVVQDALRIYEGAHTTDMYNARTENILLAAIYTAVKVHNFPLSFNHIIKSTQALSGSIFRFYQKLREYVLPTLGLRIAAQYPEENIDIFVRELDLSELTRRIALDILRTAKENSIPTDGKDIKSFTAGGVYIASQIALESRTQLEVSNIISISEVTLRHRISELRQYADIPQVIHTYQAECSKPPCKSSEDLITKRRFPGEECYASERVKEIMKDAENIINHLVIEQQYEPTPESIIDNLVIEQEYSSSRKISRLIGIETKPLFERKSISIQTNVQFCPECNSMLRNEACICGYKSII
jgi:hypothetical protein